MKLRRFSIRYLIAVTLGIPILIAISFYRMVASIPLENYDALSDAYITGWIYVSLTNFILIGALLFIIGLALLAVSLIRGTEDPTADKLDEMRRDLQEALEKLDELQS